MVNQKLIAYAERQLFGYTILDWLEQHPGTELKECTPEKIGVSKYEYFLGLQFISQTYQEEMN